MTLTFDLDRLLSNLKLKKVQQSFIMSLAKSKDRISDCDKGQTSVAYRRIGMHLLSTERSTTSSEANEHSR